MDLLLILTSFLYFYNLFILMDPKINLYFLPLKQTFLITIQSLYIPIIWKNKNLGNFKIPLLIIVITPSILVNTYLPFIELISLLIIRELNEDHFLFTTTSFLIILTINYLSSIIFKYLSF